MRPSEFTKSQINRLGDRLRKGDPIEPDLKLLDEYRRSFREAYESVVGQIRNRLKLDPTGRPAKTTTAIIEKLRDTKVEIDAMPRIRELEKRRFAIGIMLNTIAEVLPRWKGLKK